MVNVLQVEQLAGSFPHAVTFHPSCHGARLLGVREEPLALLRKVPRLRLVPLPNADDCCGFGGTFAVKLPEISAAIADEKLAHVQSTGARYLVGTDAGCLMHLAGRMQRRGVAVEALHIAELVDRALGAPAGAN
jgi:L-lactate dehydrogenase complex protein LldE